MVSGGVKFCVQSTTRGMVWNSHGQTEAIWQTLTDKGILDLAKAQFQQGADVVLHCDLVVASGPGMEQACELAGSRFSQENLDQARKKYRPARKAEP